ncbi:MAG: VanZ family protein [Gemmatimonadota bacterium]
MRRRVEAWGPVVAWAALILLLTTMRVPSPDVGRLPVDKAGHLLLYAGLGALLERARRRSDAAPAHRRGAVTGVGIAFAALDELHQRWLPWRSASAADWLVDVLGLALGVVAAARFHAGGGSRGEAGGGEPRGGRD